MKNNDVRGAQRRAQETDSKLRDAIRSRDGIETAAREHIAALAGYRRAVVFKFLSSNREKAA